MIRFTKNLLSTSPSNEIEVDNIRYNIESHNTINNVFMPEARKCSVEFFLSDDLETILNSSKIRIAKIQNNEWFDTDYSVFQAEVVSDSDGNVKFTGLVDLNSLIINFKTKEVILNIVDTMGILAALREIDIPMAENNWWVPWYQNRTAYDTLQNILGTTLERCIEGDGVHYDNINYQFNYSASGSSAFNELEETYDWVDEVYNDITFEMAALYSGYSFSIFPGHQGWGFIEEEDGTLYFYRWFHRQGWIEATGRDTPDYDIAERFAVYRRPITMTLTGPDEWWELGEWEQYFSHDVTSVGSDIGYDPYWHELIIDPDWIPFFNSMDQTMNYGYAYTFSDYSFFFIGTATYVKGFLFDYVGLLIPFEDAYETNNVMFYSFPEIVKIALITDGVQITCNSAGTIMLDKLDEYNNTHNIADTNIAEKSGKRIKSSLNIDNLEAPFMLMGYEKIEGVYPEIFQAFISPIVSWFRALYSTVYNTEYSWELFNDFILMIGDKFIYGGINYRLISFTLNEHEFTYDVVIWGE